MDLPEDLRAFLAVPANRHIALPGCQVREVTLSAPEELEERMFTATRRGRRYLVRGVDLVKACRNYPPRGVMVWFPELRQYGQWDCDHHQIIVFPGVTWSDIVAGPEPYFDGQWQPENVTHQSLRPREDS